MKTKSLVFYSTLAIIACAFANAGTGTYNWFTDTSGVTQFFSDSAGLNKLDASFTVELGVMKGPISTAQSVADNFTSLNFTTNWSPDIIATGIGGATVSADYTDTTGYPNGITAGQVLSVWIYNSKSISPSSKWAVISNTSWIITALPIGAAVTSADYTITDAGTSYSFGTLQGNKVILASASAIPEPATCAAILGVGVLGMAAYRKRRPAA